MSEVPLYRHWPRALPHDLQRDLPRDLHETDPLDLLRDLHETDRMTHCVTFTKLTT